MVFRRLQRTTQKVCSASLPLLGLVAVHLAASRCAAINDVAGDLIVMNDNGAWSCARRIDVSAGFSTYVRSSGFGRVSID
jgi:hypothetical protein